jgi:hypothetical protein
MLQPSASNLIQPIPISVNSFEGIKRLMVKKGSGKLALCRYIEQVRGYLKKYPTVPSNEISIIFHFLKNNSYCKKNTNLIELIEKYDHGRKNKFKNLELGYLKACLHLLAGELDRLPADNALDLDSSTGSARAPLLSASYCPLPYLMRTTTERFGVDMFTSPSEFDAEKEKVSRARDFSPPRTVALGYGPQGANLDKVTTFDSGNSQDIEKYHDLIRSSQSFKDGRALFDKMIIFGIKPDLETFDILIQKSSNFGELSAVFIEAKKNNIQHNTKFFDILMRRYQELVKSLANTGNQDPLLSEFRLLVEANRGHISDDFSDNFSSTRTSTSNALHWRNYGLDLDQISIPDPDCVWEGPSYIDDDQKLITPDSRPEIEEDLVSIPSTASLWPSSPWDEI